MLKLKELNIEDAAKEFEAVKKIPENENGFENPMFNNTYYQFVNITIPEFKNRSKGINLPNNYVPDTYFFLWDDNNIIGLFKIRHYLNDFLKNGPGHIGYTIINDYRGKGYASKGLKLALEISKNLIKEDEIYFAVLKNNPISLKVLLNNGAYVAYENDNEYFVRIKKQNI